MPRWSIGDARCQNTPPLASRGRQSYRCVTVIACLAVLASACSASDGESADESTPPTTGSASTSTPTTVARTTSTNDAASDLPECPVGEPLAAADLDGDGTDEDLMITEREGGQVLWACGSDGGRSLDLEYGVWYLAVVDVEPDGVDEVFLGAAGNDDAPGVVHTKLHSIEPLDDRLDAYTDDYAGVWIGPTSGAGCVDVVGNGARELVGLWVDTEASADDTVVWHREISAAIPSGEDLHAASGQFTVGRDDDAIALLSTFSCGDELVDLIRVQPPRAICEAENRYSSALVIADLDGDGLDDLVRQRQANAGEILRGDEYGGPSVAVCLGAGPTDEVLVGGMGEVFNVSGGPGNQPIVWSGGTSVSAAFSDPMVVDNGRLVFVRDEDGTILTFWDGYQGVDPTTGGEWGASGCSDVDGDGHEEFVQVVATFAGDKLDWTRRTWSMQGATAFSGASDAGSLPLPADFETQGPWDALGDLAADTC